METITLKPFNDSLVLSPAINRSETMRLAHWFIKTKKVTLKRCLSYCYKLARLKSFSSKARGTSRPAIQNNLKALSQIQKSSISLNLRPYYAEGYDSHLIYIQAQVGRNDPMFLGFLAPKYCHLIRPIFQHFYISDFKITGGPTKDIPYRYYGFNFKVERVKDE